MSGAEADHSGLRNGYMGKPLWQKLGMKPALRVRLVGAPADYWQWTQFDDATMTRIAKADVPFDFGHLFATKRRELAHALPALADQHVPNGMLWISWPKKSSGVLTDISENTLREMALPRGLVDVKVCAVSAVWSGLKFVWRLPRRS